MIIRLILLIFIIVYLSLALSLQADQDVSDVTSQYNSAGFIGILAAFADFNADKWTDIFTISDDGKKIYIYEAIKNEKLFNGRILHTSGSSKIISLVPGDYDADNFMDLLIVTQADTSLFNISVLWGASDRISLTKSQYNLPLSIKSEPTIIDYNNDMIPDILVVKPDGDKREVYCGVKGEREFILVTSNTLNTTSKPMIIDHSNSFMDIDGDYIADILISNEDGIEIYLSKNGEYKFDREFKPLNSELIEVKGHFLAIDVNRSSSIDLLTPICYDKLCKQSAICFNSDYCQNLTLHDSSNKLWTFSPYSLHPISNVKIPLTLRSGDYDTDGFDDIIVTLQSTASDGTVTYKPLILMNKPCSNCGVYNRHFVPHFEIDLSPPSRNFTSSVATFYDLNENGNLDIIVCSKSNTGEHFLHIFKTSQDGNDAYFIKVAVGSGICSTNCPGYSVFSVNCPGTTIGYVITALSDSSKQLSIGVQLYRSNSFSLQLPYNIFGLDSTPNYVDSMMVGIQSNLVKRTNTWKQIIPNSQMIVLPIPNDIPSRWSLRLSLKPRLAVETGIVLASTCVLMSIIVAVLHWREKNEDKAERRQGSHRFHFDAM